MNITGQNKMPEDARYAAAMATAAVHCCQSRGSTKKTILTGGWIQLP